MTCATSQRLHLTSLPSEVGLSPRKRSMEIALLGLLLLFAGCKSAQIAPATAALFPSNDREWSPDQALLSTAKFRGDQVIVSNIRNCKHISDGEYVVDHYDKTFDLNKVQTVDFMVVPFTDMPSLAHTMLSFGMSNDEYLGLSIEIRKEKGETYNPLKGAMRQYELMYVVADERDMIRLRTDIYKDQVYMYRIKTTPEKAKALLVDVLQRANKLAKQPEFYDTLSNNCSNNLVAHVNKISPNKVPYTLDVLLPGSSDKLIYDLGLVDTTLPFSQAKAMGNINELAKKYSEAPDFSARIRTQVLANTSSGRLLR